MAFSIILRRVAASSSATPLAIRAICGGIQRNFSSALFNPLKKNTSNLCEGLIRKAYLPIHQFSSLSSKQSSDRNLLQVIDSEITVAETVEFDTWVREIPAGFEFEFKDNPRQETISLKREYQGEIIEVEVQMPSFDDDEDDDDNDGDGSDDDDGNDDDDDVGDNGSMPLVVSVSKGSGTCLEFCITAYPHEISVDSLSVKKQDALEDENAYEGPDFSELDENLQKAFLKYLEVRGITLSTTNFLRDYMIGKESREYINWLKEVKQFIES